MKTPSGAIAAPPIEVAPDAGQMPTPDAAHALPPNDDQGGGQSYELPPEIIERLQRLQELEKFAPVADHLRQEGYADADHVQQQLHLQQFLAQQEAALHQQYQDRVDRGEMTPEQAQVQFEQELQVMVRELAANTVLGQFHDAQTEAHLSHVTSAYPHTLGASGDEGRALIKILHQATGQPLEHIAQFVHELIASHAHRAVSAYAAQQQGGAHGALPIPQGGGYGSPAPLSPRGNAKSSWADLLNLGR